MRTNIDIDDKLMKQAMKALGVETKKAAVDRALRQALEIHGQKLLRKLRGKVVWRGHDDNWFGSDGEVIAARETAKRASPAKARRIA
jgi:Arc/MetJ family transcription regulator